MLNGAINEQVPAYLESLGQRSIPVMVMERLQQFPMLQEATHNGTLGYAKRDFLGLADWIQQIEMYSDTHVLLRMALSVIRALVPLNSLLSLETTVTPEMGTVGILLPLLHNYDAMFAVQPSDADDLSGLARKLV